MITRVLLCETDRKKTIWEKKQQPTIIIGLTTYAKKYYDTTSRYSCFAGRKCKMQFIELYDAISLLSSIFNW